MAVIDKSYHKLLKLILVKGYRYEDPNRKGINRIQIPSYTFEHNFEDGFPAITTKKLYWKGVVGELLWFLRGDTNIKYLIDNNINIWNKDAYNFYLNRYEKYPLGKEKKSFDEWLNKQKEKRTKYSGNLGRIYGGQWRNWVGLEYDSENVTFLGSKTDQISNLIKGLKENPMGTKHIVTAWNPAELDKMALPPCHWSFEILVEPINISERRKLTKGISLPTLLDAVNIPKYQFTLKWHQRSVDTFLGLPFNIASYALLAQIIGKMTGMIPKGIIGDLSNVHIYEPHLDAVKEQLSRDVNKYKNPNFVIDSHVDFSQDNIENTLNNLMIKDFNLEFYKSYSAIPAEMLAYNKKEENEKK